MTTDDRTGRSPWTDAVLSAALFAVDAVGTGGVTVRAGPGPVRDRWLALLRGFLPGSAAMRRIPHHVSDSRLLGALDLAATLQAGRPVAERGLLHDADGGVLVLTTAERLSPLTAARIGSVLDSREVLLERDGLAERRPTSFGVVMLDEGIDDERPPLALLDRLAFQVNLEGIRWSEARDATYDGEGFAVARHGLPQVQVSDDIFRAICETSVVFGIASIRAPLLAMRVARAAAALAGRSDVLRGDAELAAALVLAPRATVVPTAEQPKDMKGETASGADRGLESGIGQEDQNDQDKQDEGGATAKDRPLGETVTTAAQAAIPAGLLAQLQVSLGKKARVHAPGRGAVLQSSLRRGRPAGVRRGEPRDGARLNVVETLRTAAPWQELRRRDALRTGAPTRQGRRIDLRREDFRVTRFKQRSEATSIFAVDASGSSALHRLAEVKGAVELLLADCYVRRDRVALFSFRGRNADLILPPTRSLARAKRCLAGQPGGGGTPLAAAIDAAAMLADSVRRRGQTPIVVLLTDGRANVARDGTPGRGQAEVDALASARMMRATGITALVVDTSSHPHPSAQRLAAEMGARYLPLPHVDAGKLSQAVLTAQHSGRRSAR
jgi:magnesium chelatase subunit D